MLMSEGAGGVKVNNEGHPYSGWGEPFAPKTVRKSEGPGHLTYFSYKATTMAHEVFEGDAKDTAWKNIHSLFKAS
jgi:hypothetical protein